MIDVGQLARLHQWGALEVYIRLMAFIGSFIPSPAASASHYVSIFCLSTQTMFPQQERGDTPDRISRTVVFVRLEFPKRGLCS